MGGVRVSVLGAESAAGFRDLRLESGCDLRARLAARHSELSKGVGFQDLGFSFSGIVKSLVPGRQEIQKLDIH